MRKATLKASVCAPAPRRAAKTCSRTRPRTRDTMVMAETRPVARRAPREPPDWLAGGAAAGAPAAGSPAVSAGLRLTSLKPLVILDFCRKPRRSLRGAQRISEEAVSPEPEAQG